MKSALRRALVVLGFAVALAAVSAEAGCGSAAIGPANPDSIRYGAWEGNVDPGAIDSAVRDVKGVLRGTVVTPSSLVAANDPAYPNDATIELLIAGRILVHAQH